MQPLQTAVIFSVQLVSIWSTFIKKNKFQIQKWNLIFKVKNIFSRLPLFRPPTQSSVSKARWAKTLWGHYKYTNSICVLYSWLLHVSTQSEKRRVEKKTCEERRVWENTLRDSAPFYSLPPVDICHSSQGVCGRQRSLGNLWKQRKRKNVLGY